MKKMIVLLLIPVLYFAQPKLAVYGFTSETFSKREIASLNAILESALIDLGTFKVLTREDIKIILRERNLSDVGLVNPEDFGKMIGARYVIFGKVERSFGKVGYATVSVKIIDADSGEIVFAEAEEVPISSTKDAIEEIVGMIGYKDGKIFKMKKSERHEIGMKEEKAQKTLISIGGYYFYDPTCDYYYYDYYCEGYTIPMVRFGTKEGDVVYGFNLLLGVFARKYFGPFFGEIGLIAIFVPYIEAGLALGPIEVSAMYLIFPGISFTFTF